MQLRTLITMSSPAPSPSPPPKTKKASPSSRKTASNSSKEGNYGSEAFPFRLYDMLEEAERQGFDHIVSWLPTGKGFRVRRLDDFVSQILPRYFNQQTKYKSFQRQLNMYEFKTTRGRGVRKQQPGCLDDERGTFQHPMFYRGNRNCCRLIPRKTSGVHYTALVNQTLLELQKANRSDILQAMQIHQKAAAAAFNGITTSTVDGATTTAPSSRSSKVARPASFDAAGLPPGSDLFALTEGDSSNNNSTRKLSRSLLVEKQKLADSAPTMGTSDQHQPLPFQLDPFRLVEDDKPSASTGSSSSSPFFPLGGMAPLNPSTTSQATRMGRISDVLATDSAPMPLDIMTAARAAAPHLQEPPSTTSSRKRVKIWTNRNPAGNINDVTRSTSPGGNNNERYSLLSSTATSLHPDESTSGINRRRLPSLISNPSGNMEWSTMNTSPNNVVPQQTSLTSQVVSSSIPPPPVVDGVDRNIVLQPAEQSIIERVAASITATAEEEKVAASPRGSFNSRSRRHNPSWYIQHRASLHMYTQEAVHLLEVQEDFEDIDGDDDDGDEVVVPLQKKRKSIERRTSATLMDEATAPKQEEVVDEIISTFRFLEDDDN